MATQKMPAYQGAHNSASSSTNPMGQSSPPTTSAVVAGKDAPSSHQRIDLVGPQDPHRLEQELSNAWDTIDEWKTYHEHCTAETAKQNASKEAQIQQLLKAVQERDVRLRNQDADILEKTRQITQLTMEDRHLTKSKAHQEARKQLKARISSRDEVQQQKDKISLLNTQVLTAQQACHRTADENTQQRKTISSLQSELYIAQESARSARARLTDENQQQRDEISRLQRQINAATQAADRDRIRQEQEYMKQVDTIVGLQERLYNWEKSAEQACERQKALSDQRQEAVTALDELKEEFARCKKKLKRSKAATISAEAEVEKVKDMDRKGCSIARDVRYWDKNRRAEKYSQAGKYEQDAVRAAKEFDCGCSTCKKRG